MYPLYPLNLVNAVHLGDFLQLLEHSEFNFLGLDELFEVLIEAIYVGEL